MKKDKKKSISGAVWIIIGVITLLVLGIAVPFIINEFYKKGGYVTEWSCGELLDYYGSLLGSVATIAALIFTIRFTRKQVVSERKIESETKKWEAVEKLFDEALDTSNPYLLTSIFFSYEKSGDYLSGMLELENQFAKTNLAHDKVRYYVSEIDDNIYKNYKTELCNSAIQLNGLVGEFNSCKKIYFDCLAELIKTDENDEEKIIEIRHTASDNLKSVRKLYKEKYQALLKNKNKVFSEIYSDIVNKGNKSL